MEWNECSELACLVGSYGCICFEHLCVVHTEGMLWPGPVLMHVNEVRLSCTQANSPSIRITTAAVLI